MKQNTQSTLTIGYALNKSYWDIISLFFEDEDARRLITEKAHVEWVRKFISGNHCIDDLCYNEASNIALDIILNAISYMQQNLNLQLYDIPGYIMHQAQEARLSDYILPDIHDKLSHSLPKLDSYLTNYI